MKMAERDCKSKGGKEGRIRGNGLALKRQSFWQETFTININSNIIK
jgi:hypothetical protein